MSEQDYNLGRIAIHWVGVLILALIVTVSAYYLADRLGPVKPYVHMEYSWPTGVPSK